METEVMNDPFPRHTTLHTHPASASANYASMGETVVRGVYAAPPKGICFPVPMQPLSGRMGGCREHAPHALCICTPCIARKSRSNSSAAGSGPIQEGHSPGKDWWREGRGVRGGEGRGARVDRQRRCSALCNDWHAGASCAEGSSRPRLCFILHDMHCLETVHVPVGCGSARGTPSQCWAAQQTPTDCWNTSAHRPCLNESVAGICRV